MELKIKLGNWLPDQPDYDNGITVASNCLPVAKGYASTKGLTDFSNAADSKLTGIFALEDSSGNAIIFAGNRTKLYKYNGTTNNLDDVSKAGGYNLSSTDRWRFVQFGDKVIATGGVGQDIQVFDLGTSTNFADLATGVNATHICIVRDFVFTANNSDSISRVRWSALGDATSWTTSATTQADFQEINDLGQITGLVGGESVTIFCERGIVIGRYVGSPLIFQFDNVENNRGVQYGGSITNVARTSFYYTDDGFYSFDARTGSSPIGHEKVDKFFQANFNITYKDNLSASVDPKNKVVMFAYPSIASSDGSNDKILVYNYVLDKWSLLNLSTDVLSKILTPATTLEGLDSISGNNLDSMTTSLDSEIWKGGNILMVGSQNNKISTFSGTTLTATITTGEFSIQGEKLSMLTKVRPYYETTGNALISTQVATRNTHEDNFSFNSAVNINSDGFTPHRTSGRYNRIQINLSNDWKNIQEIDVELQTFGAR